jgi:phosphoribosylformylglycinamidine cyclo-ligase
MDYRDAGVDISAADAAKDRIKALARSTFNPSVLTEIGSFGGMFRPDTVGYDLVAHCVDDILVQGAVPLFFLDYVALGKLDPEKVEAIVSGFARACAEFGCPLLGGETAEMPGTYAEDDYDLAGFIVGILDRERALPRGVCEGDVLVGLPSTGLHTNGYSLARKLFFEVAGLPVDQFVPELDRTIGEELMRVHRCYAPAVLPILDDLEIRGMAHITGGGLPDNLVRCLPEGCRAVVERGSWHVPSIFRLIQDLGSVPDEDMYHTFNMGVGYVLVVPETIADEAASRLSAAGETGYRIGRIESGELGVQIV